MGVVAVRLQDLKRELIWDGENMKFLNISDTDEIKVVSSDKFEVIEGHPHFDTKHNNKQEHTRKAKLQRKTWEDSIFDKKRQCLQKCQRDGDRRSC